MAVSIRTNVSSLIAQVNLRNATDASAKSQERLSTGLRINHANDDPAGYAVASRANADAVVAHTSVKNANSGISYLDTAREAVDTLQTLLSSLDELSTKSSNSSVSSAQRASMSTEFETLKTEYNRIVTATEVNYQDVFTSTNNSITIQAGYGSNGQITANLISTDTANVGNGTFTAGGSWGFAATVDDITLKDLNSDGELDMVFSGTGSFQIEVALGNGNGTFLAATSYGFGRFGNSVADLNNDGRQDIVSYFGTGGATGILLGNGDGTFKETILYTNNTNGYGDVGDTNGDGIIDILSYNSGGSGAATIMLGVGDGTFKAATSFVSPAGTNQAASFDDFNKDGVLDIYTSNGSAIFISLGNGDGTFKLNTSFNGAADMRPETHDLDGDGNLDIVAGATSGGGSLNIFYGNGNGTFKAFVSYQAGGVTGVYDPQFGDSNDDGIIDIISGATGGVTTLLGNGDGTFKAAVTNTGIGRHIALADFNGDNAIDMVAGTGTRPTTYIQNLSATTSTRRVRQISGLAISTQENATDAQSIVEHEQRYLTQIDGQMRAGESRLESAVSLNEVQAVNFDTAVSKITEVDVADEAAKLIRNQLFQQAATATYQEAASQFDLAGKLIDGIG